MDNRTEREKRIEYFVTQYIADNKPLKEIKHYLKKEFADVTYDETCIIIKQVVETCLIEF